jgi:hypothetical protein
VVPACAVERKSHRSSFAEVLPDVQFAHRFEVPDHKPRYSISYRRVRKPAYHSHPRDFRLSYVVSSLLDDVNTTVLPGVCHSEAFLGQTDMPSIPSEWQGGSTISVRNELNNDRHKIHAANYQYITGPPEQSQPAETHDMETAHPSNPLYTSLYQIGGGNIQCRN